MARLLLLLLGLGAHTLARQSWTKQPQYTEVNPGESAVLSCVIAGKEGDCRSELQTEVHTKFHNHGTKKAPTRAFSWLKVDYYCFHI